MIFFKENNNNRNKRQFYKLKLSLISIFFFLGSISLYAQDSIPEKKDLTEEAALKFQDFFFKALSEKSIGNYQNAIENLESCNQILPNDISVFFEFSKNYLLINNFLLAKEYINRALVKDSNNKWLLKHLVKIYQKENNLNKAIEVQKQLVKQYPKERFFLVKLYLYNRNYKKAISLINTLEKEDVLPSSLKKIKQNLVKRDQKKVKEIKPVSDLYSLIENFKNNKSFEILKEILVRSENNIEILLKFSNEGILLFPAQPYVYLVNGKALNSKKSYKKALTILQNGLDFVIDEVMEVDFYKAMAEAYRGLGKSKEEKKYILKAKKIKI